MYSEIIWDAWLLQELKNYKIILGKRKYIKRGYLHLNQRYWLPENIDEIKDLLKSNLLIYNSTTKIKEYYSFSPFLKLLMKTPRFRYQFEEGQYELETKIRPICFAAHKDSLIMGYYSFALTKAYESYIKDKFDDVVLAYRSDLGKCNIQFAKEVFDIVKLKKECSAITLDIKGFFDHIDHDILLEKWKQMLGGKLPEDQIRLYRVLTKYSYINYKSILKKYKGPLKRNEKSISNLMSIVPGNNINEKFKQLKKDQLIVTNNIINKNTDRLCGIPQGSPISALLSNIFLIDFDYDLKIKSELEGFSYRRYCDDIVIICDIKKAKELMNFVIEKIKKEYFLIIQNKKVDLIDFHKNSKGHIRAFRRPRKNVVIFGEVVKSVIKDKPALTTILNEEKFYKPLQYLGFEFNGKNISLRSSSLSRFFRKLNYRLQKTVIMAHSPQNISDQIFMRQIYEKYSHVGTRNFLSYAYKAAKKNYEGGNGILKEGLNSPTIKRQLIRHVGLLKHELARKNEKWFLHKLKGKKMVTPKF